MSGILWSLVAWIASRPMVARWLIRRAMRTPYVPIMSKDGKTLYMDRWWLFNPYEHKSAVDTRRWKSLPSIRIHHIREPDSDRHMHNHPWRRARTIILDGHYCEHRLRKTKRWVFPGSTHELHHDDFHRIGSVCYGGVYTMFITWGVGQDWGFMMQSGAVMHHKEYFDKYGGA